MNAAYKGSEKLKDKVAIITGGDFGVGRSVAVLFAREGADVTITYFKDDSAAQETKHLIEAEGQKCLVINPKHSGDEQFCQIVVKETIKQFGKLDILVNNAIFQEYTDSVFDITPEKLQEILNSSVFNYFSMVKAALPHLKWGSNIINVSSAVGLRGSGHLLDYAVTGIGEVSSKGAINAFTVSLADNLLPNGIRVNAIAPGPVWLPPNNVQPEKTIRFGNIGSAVLPDELSPAFVFLASPIMSNYITGLVLPIFGGSTGAI